MISRQTCDVPLLFVDECHLVRVIKNARCALKQPPTENHGVRGDVAPPRKTGDVCHNALPAHALLTWIVFRLLMYRELVLVGDGRRIPERKSK